MDISLQKYEQEMKKLYPFLNDDEIKDLTYEMYQVLKRWYVLEFES